MKIKLTAACRLIISACIIMSVIPSCNKSSEILAPPDLAVASANKGNPNTLATVSLRVIVSLLNSDGSECKIKSNGQGDYINATQNVQALIDQYGTFVFNTRASTRKAAVRWVNYTFDAPVDNQNTYRPTPSNNNNYHFSTGASAFSPFIPLQNLGINGNPSTQCIYMGNGFSNSTNDWRVSFHKGFEDVSNTPTAFAVVTRTKISPAEWIITPIGTCSPNSNVAALRSGDGSVLFGYYILPFYFILKAQ